jgi:hypothetical protein
MSLNELIPALQTLSRADKLRLIQFLVIELAKEENVPLLDMDKNYPVWSPYDAFEAANTLLEALAEYKIGHQD